MIQTFAIAYIYFNVICTAVVTVLVLYFNCWEFKLFKDGYLQLSCYLLEYVRMSSAVSWERTGLPPGGMKTRRNVWQNTYLQFLSFTNHKTKCNIKILYTIKEDLPK